MAFIKLDTGIIRSTIWFDRPALEVFITALLLAEPAEYDVPVPQLKVGALEPTGWSAPPGWYGFVPASGPGLVAAAQVDQATGLAALARMGEPEPTSRSQDHEGRRIIRIDGGFLLLNYVKYRDKDHTTAERSARYRDRKRHGVIPSRHGVTGRGITHADADADADAKLKISDPKKEKTRAREPGELKQSSRELGTFGAPALSFSFKEGWQPNAEHRARGQELGLTDDEMLARADDCLLKAYPHGFKSEDAQFMRELAWAARDKEKAKFEETRRRNVNEKPGANRGK